VDVVRTERLEPDAEVRLVINECHRSSVSQIIHKVLRRKSATRIGALNSWLKRTACTRYFRYAVWETITW